jgi:transposase
LAAFFDRKEWGEGNAGEIGGPTGKNQDSGHRVDIEILVPQCHLVRKIDGAVDFKRIYELVEHLYSEDNGRSSADPVVLVKITLIQHLYGYAVYSARKGQR